MMDNGKHEPRTFTSPWLNTEAAGAYLSASPKTLAVWRSQGRGPRYRTCGGRLVLYHRDDLDVFVLGNDSGS